MEHEHLHPDVEVVEVALLYDTGTGEIIGSHILATAGPVTESARRRFEGALQKEIVELEQRHNRKLGIHRSAEANGLKSLHHRIDVATGRLVEKGAPPLRLRVG